MKKTEDMPATIGALNHCRNELKSDIASVHQSIQSLEKRMDSRFIKFESGMESKFIKFESKMDAKFKKFEAKIDARFAEVDARFIQLEGKMDSRFLAVDARFASVEAKLEDLKSTNHRMLAILEEQNTRNKMIMDGYASLFTRQERIENRVDKIEKELM